MDDITKYEVLAYNSAKDSENLMHRDAVAQRLGFSGGLVPGVDLIAYLSHMPLNCWGDGFLAGGRLSAKLLKPVYEDDRVLIEALASNDELNLTARVSGEICVEGVAARSHPEGSSDLADVDVPAPPDPDSRPTFGAISLPVGSLLGTRPHVLSPETHAEHLDSVRETHPAYRDKQIVHPGFLSRLLNWSLLQNLRMGPWIHAAADLRFFQIAHVGDELSVSAQVIINERRANRSKVILDGLIVANASVPIALVKHTVYIPLTE